MTVLPEPSGSLPCRSGFIHLERVTSSRASTRSCPRPAAQCYQPAPSLQPRVHVTICADSNPAKVQSVLPKEAEKRELIQRLRT